jgi:DNA-binding NtrC family response regulator
MVSPLTSLFDTRRSSGSVLLIRPDPEDAVFMREIIASLNCQFESASNWHTAELALQRDIFGIIVAERDLPDGNWRDVLSCLERYSYNPLLIVISRLADERLWAEVLNRCGFDVLAKPFAYEEATRVIGHALNTWNRRFDKEGRATTRDSATRRRPVGRHHRGLAEYGT